MPNVLGSLWNGVSHAVTTPLKGAGQMLTNPKKGFNTLKHNFGDQERYNRKTFASVGIRGWAGKHPTESVGALVATIFGGWAAWGAYGAGAAGGAAGAGAGSAAGGASAGAAGMGSGTAITGASSGSLLGSGSAMAYAPTASSALAGTSGAAAGTGAGATAGGSAGLFGGAGSAMAYAPTSSSAFMGGGVGAAGESTAGLGISGSGTTAFPELTANSFQGSLGSGSGWLGSDSAPIESGNSWQDWARKANQNKDQQQQQQEHVKAAPINYNQAKPFTADVNNAGASLYTQSANQILNAGKNITGNSFGSNY